MSDDVQRSDSPASYRSTIGDRPPSIAAIQAVASLRGTDPTEMTDTLYDYLDPEALDRLLGNPKNGPVSVVFRMGDEVVELGNDGRLDLRVVDD